MRYDDGWSDPYNFVSEEDARDLALFAAFFNPHVLEVWLVWEDTPVPIYGLFPWEKYGTYNARFQANQDIINAIGEIGTPFVEIIRAGWAATLPATNPYFPTVYPPN